MILQADVYVLCGYTTHEILSDFGIKTDHIIPSENQT